MNYNISFLTQDETRRLFLMLAVKAASSTPPLPYHLLMLLPCFSPVANTREAGQTEYTCGEEAGRQSEQEGGKEHG
jgi:hypothetical protein